MNILNYEAIEVKDLAEIVQKSFKNPSKIFQIGFLKF